MSGLLHRPRYADVVGTLALIVAMSGTANAAHALPKHSVGNAQLKRSAVSSAKIKNGQVKSTDVRDGSLTTVDVADASLALADIVRVDTTVSVTVVVNSDTCVTLDLNVPGAEVGQVALLVPTQGTATAVFAPARVSAPGVVSTRVCAVGLGAVLSQSPFRVLTLA